MFNTIVFEKQDAWWSVFNSHDTATWYETFSVFFFITSLGLQRLERCPWSDADGCFCLVNTKLCFQPSIEVYVWSGISFDQSDVVTAIAPFSMSLTILPHDRILVSSILSSLTDLRTLWRWQICSVGLFPSCAWSTASKRHKNSSLHHS